MQNPDMTLRKKYFALTSKIPDYYQEIITENIKYNIWPFVARLNSVQSYYAHRVVINPFETIWIDPNSIQYITIDEELDENIQTNPKFKEFDVIFDSGKIYSGKWDQRRIPFNEIDVYTGLKQRFTQGYDWEDTILFQRVSKQIQQGQTKWGCTTVNQYLERCENLDLVYEDMQLNGYKSQRTLGKDPLDEITVNIGRKGELLFNDGRHRLSMAKILGLNEIPIRIVVWHEDFISGSSVRNFPRDADF